ncbi:uncharacterized protein LOC126371169 isoform X2 [Pectinophora gossypiella]|nr:uncharacterized protein LOC126371169 isoform X2 [Pectinophora gossypiella]
MARGCCERALPALLAHVNLLLAVYSGAALATGARLKWDPSAYIVAREAVPAEYRAAAVLLPAAAAALLLLAHAALAALFTSPSTRRWLLLLYAAGMAVLLAGEVAGALWLRARLAGWLASPAAADLAHTASTVRAHLVPMLEALARLHPVVTRIKELMEEVEQDAPRNVYVAAGAGAALLLLQAAALLLALLQAAADARRPHAAAGWAGVDPPTARRALSHASTNGTSAVHERALLSAVHR